MGCTCSCTEKPDIKNEDLRLTNEIVLTYSSTSDRKSLFLNGLSIDSFRTQLACSMTEPGEGSIEANASKVQDIKSIKLEMPTRKSGLKLKLKLLPGMNADTSGSLSNRNTNMNHLKSTINNDANVESTISSPRRSSYLLSTLNSPGKSRRDTGDLKLGSPRKRTAKPLEKKVVIFIVYPPGINKDKSIFPLFGACGFEKISIEKLVLEDGPLNEKWGKKLKKYLSSGKEIPSKILVSLIEEKIECSNLDRFLISGFPKNEDQANCWKKHLNKKYNIGGFVMITYTRKEYEIEVTEMVEKQGARISFKEAVVNFDYFIQNTYKLCDYFGASKCIKISATLKDDLIASTILKNEMVASKIN